MLVNRATIDRCEGLGHVPDSGRAADDREEHAVEVHIAEAALDFIPVQIEGHDGYGEIQGAPDHVAFADVRLRHSGVDHRVATTWIRRNHFSSNLSFHCVSMQLKPVHN